MRLCRLIGLSVALAMASAVAAEAGPLRPDEAKRFVAGKLFSYTCFDGTRGTGRIYADGSVVGTMQAPGKPVRFVAMPTGTIRVTTSSICASLRGALFQPCFDVVQTSGASFRGSLSGIGFAYCDFVRSNPRQQLTSPRRAAPSAPPPPAGEAMPKATPIAGSPRPTPIQSAVMVP
jgi:hypothetical protein